MATKTITIMEDAYELLARNKRSDESFSEELRRILGKKKGLLALAGAWKDMPAEEINRIKTGIEEGRKSTRLKEVMARYDR